MKKQQSISKWTTKVSQQQTQVESAVPQERNSNKGSVCESRKQEAAVEHAEVVKPSLPQVEDKLSVTDLLKQNQPKNIKFPVQTFGKSKRSFSADWFTQFTWLHYNESLDAAFCFICMKAIRCNSISSANVENDFIRTGY